MTAMPCGPGDPAEVNDLLATICALGRTRQREIGSGGELRARFGDWCFAHGLEPETGLFDVWLAEVWSGDAPSADSVAKARRGLR